MIRRRVYEVAAALTALLLGAALGWVKFSANRPSIASHFALTEPLPSTPAPELGLRDAQGALRRIEEYRGRVLVLFFGFTRCAEICPTELFKLSQVMQQLGEDAARVQVSFVTLDPERDAPEILQRYTASFDPRFTGFTGSRSEVDAAAGRYFVAHAKSGEGADYVIDHSTSTYIIDVHGKLRLLGGLQTRVPELVHDLRLLLRE